jgi:hypothetical protein
MPKAQDAFLSDLHTVQATAQAGIVSSQASSDDFAWKIWANFCNDLFANPPFAH